jgi:hypothetical protein
MPIHQVTGNFKELEEALSSEGVRNRGYCVHKRTGFDICCTIMHIGNLHCRDTAYNASLELVFLAPSQLAVRPKSSKTLNTNRVAQCTCPPPKANATAVASRISFRLAPKSAALLTWYSIQP